MNTEELRDDAKFYGETAFEMKRQHLYGQIKKALERCEASIEEMEISGRNTTHDGKQEYRLLKHMSKCYAKLFNEDIKNKKDLEKVEWLFNGGKLRSEEEVDGMAEKMKQEKYYNEVYLPTEYAMSELQDEVSSLTTWGGIALGLSLAAAFVFLRDDLLMIDSIKEIAECYGSFVWNVYDAPPMLTFLWMPAIPIGLLIAKGIGLIVEAIIEIKLQRMAHKAGVKKQIGASVLAETAMLGAAALGVRGMFKSGKKK
jgi:hypothetical protein